MKNRVILIVLFIMTIFGVGAQTNENVFSMKLGKSRVVLLSEGQRNGSTEILIDAKPEIIEKYAPGNSFLMATNAFLWQVGGKNILFDTGYGKALVENLQSLGLKPENIDVIFITHAHGDHIGGLLHNDQVVFPNAALYVPQAAYDYWMDEEVVKHMPEDERMGFSLVKKVLTAYKDRLHLFEPNPIEGPYEKAVYPGIKAIAAPGHTVGHTVYLVESDKEKLLIWGDLVHSIAVQMPHPEIAATYDINPGMAIQSRLILLQFVSSGSIYVAGAHIPYPGIGTVEKSGTGYRFVPAK